MPRHRRLRTLCALFITALSFLAVADEAATTSTQEQLGALLYRNGAASTLGSLQATGQGRMQLSDGDAACIRCHRRSGLGVFEGGKAVRPITARDLFNDRDLINLANVQTQPSRAGVRPGYDAQSLRKALTQGIDSSGRSLDPLMPRFRLSDDQYTALLAFLRTLSAHDAPGVTNDVMHIATIIDERSNAVSRTAMLDMINAYVGNRNNESRGDSHRARSAQRIREPMYERYRKVELHVWTLRGDEATWPTQLESYYSAQPIFAVMGGIASGDWTPIHDFCERRSVPCLYPNTELPAVRERDFYTLYFSQGRALDGRAAAAYIVRNAAFDAGRAIVQLWRAHSSADSAAHAFRASLDDAARSSLVDIALTDNAGVDTIDWSSRSLPAALVVWLDDDEWPALFAHLPDTLRNIPIVLATRRADPASLPELPAGYAQRAVLYPYALPADRTQQRRRMEAWMRTQHLALTDDIVQANTFFMLTVAGEALKHITGDFSRDYFVERIESMTENMPVSSGFHHVSLGPDQRYASRGVYVIALPETKPNFSSARWLVP